MKITGIRSKLITYFLSLLLIVAALNVIFAVLHVVIVNRYEYIGTNIFKQNDLIASTENLISSYNNYRNVQSDQNLKLYNVNKQVIDDIFIYLDQSITESDSRLAFAGVQKTINSVISVLDQGMQDIKINKFENLSARVTEANRKFSFVKESVANLLLKEIVHSAELQATASHVNKLSLLFGAILIVIVLIATIIVSFLWSDQIIKPLSKLDIVVKKFSRGDIEVDVDHDLIGNKDEVGSLAKSFDLMVHRLREVMSSLKHSNEEIGKAKDSAEELVRVRTIELSTERSRLIASINSISFGFIIVDTSNSIILKNNAIMDLFGFKDKDDITVEKISEQLGGFNIEIEAERCLKGKTVCETKEILFNRKVLRGIVAPIMSEEVNNKKIGYVLILEDITEAKVMERSRDEFFAIASHELRTPLTAIRGNSEMIMDNFGDKITDPDMREMLSDINESSVRLIGIVNDFLEVSRLEQGKVEIKSKKFDIVELAERVVRDLRGAIKEKEVTLELVAPTQSVPHVFGDTQRVEQVLVNLIGNSLKFTNNGSIDVSLNISGEFVMVSVKDTGIGISDQNKVRLFRKFQQAGESMLARDVTQGTGLGLYISQLIVSSMGGTLGLVSSELGKGSAFAFTIPISKDVDPM